MKNLSVLFSKSTNAFSMKTARHGDILFRKINKLPEGAKEIEVTSRFVVAEGEHTGHKHVATAEKSFSIMALNELRFMVVDVPTKITHEEHAEIIIEEGIYQIDQEREFDYFNEVIAQVRD